MLSKNANNKKCAPKLVFFNEKKIWKIWMIFDFDFEISRNNLSEQLGY